MTHLACSLLLLAILSPGAGRTEPPPLEGSRLRGIDAAARRLLDEGLRRSDTIRQLAARIEHSDLIVYVQLEPNVERTGTTRLLSSAGGARFVLVGVSPVAARFDLVMRLGHELRHVVEIADAPGVHDDAGMRALFKQIGWRSGRGDSWETDAAIATGRRVYEDLWTRPSPPTVVARASR